MYDIMNLDRFILEVPAELQMRRKQRKKDGIMNLDRFILEVLAELRMRRKQRKKDGIMNLDRFILCAESSADTESHLQQIMDSAKRGKNDKRTDT